MWFCVNMWGCHKNMDLEILHFAKQQQPSHKKTNLIFKQMAQPLAGRAHLWVSTGLSSSTSSSSLPLPGEEKGKSCEGGRRRIGRRRLAGLLPLCWRAQEAHCHPGDGRGVTSGSARAVPCLGLALLSQEEVERVGGQVSHGWRGKREGGRECMPAQHGTHAT